jgi:hypothetical protein
MSKRKEEDSAYQGSDAVVDTAAIWKRAQLQRNEPETMTNPKQEGKTMETSVGPKVIYGTFHCPTCDGVLLTDQPHQTDIEGFCSACDRTFNVEFCKHISPDGEVAEGWLDADGNIKPENSAYQGQ